MIRLEDLNIDNLKIYQDDEKYCFTSDAIILSHFAKPKKSGEVVADFCSGSGVVGLNFYGLNRDKVKSVTLFEMQKPLYDLSVKSVEHNQLSQVFTCENVKVQEIDKKYHGYFSLILCNPPFTKKGSGFSSEIDHISVCKSELTIDLDQLIKAMAYCLKPNGRVCMVHRADRVLEISGVMKSYKIEPKILQFIGRENKPPYTVLIEGVKGAREGLKILANYKN